MIVKWFRVEPRSSKDSLPAHCLPGPEVRGGNSLHCLPDPWSIHGEGRSNIPFAVLAKTGPGRHNDSNLREKHGGEGGGGVPLRDPDPDVEGRLGAIYC